MQNKMSYVPIPKLITMMSLPVIFSMLVQSLYNFVDSIYVSRVSEDALTAVSLSFPLQLIVIAAFVGLGTGISSMISRKLGEKDVKSATLAAEHGLLISLILYVIVAAIGLIITLFFFEFFTKEQTILNDAKAYTRIVMLFSLGSIATQSGMSILRGTGEMIKPMFAQLLGAVTNIILDPIFIFTFGLGVKGAAIATVTAQFISMFFILFIVLKKQDIIKLNLREFKYKSSILVEIIKVGIPSFIMQSLGSIMLTVFNFILSGFGDSAIAVLGVYFRTQSLVFMPVFGLSIGTMPVIGFNFGAKNKRRLFEAVRFSSIMAFIFMSLCLVIFQIFPDTILGIFKASDEMLAIGIPAFRTISLMFPIISITIIFSTTFQAVGEAYISMIVSIIRQIAVLLPAAYFLSRISLDAIWYSFLIAEFVGIIVIALSLIHLYRHRIRNFSVE